MIVRSLTTLLDYKTNNAGLNEYGSALKRLAGWAAALFSAREIMDVADEWSNVAARVLNVTSSVAEQTTAMEALQKAAAETGQSFEGVGSLFTTMQANKDTLGFTTEQVTDLSGAIAKLVTISGATGDQGRGLMASLEGVFTINQLTLRQIRSMPELAETLSKAYGGMPKFLELVRSGKFTSKMLAEGLMGERAEIGRLFLNMPVTFTRAFTTVRDYFGGLIYDIGRATGIWSTLAKAIITGSEWMIARIRWLSDAVGGWGNVLRLAGMAFVALMGPAAIRMVVAMIGVLRSLTLASFMAAAPWYLLVALILAVGLAIDDVWAWFEGRPSLLGDLIGPVEAWQGKIDEWKAYITGAFETVKAEITALGASLGLVGENWGFAHMVHQLAEDFRDIRRIAQEVKDVFTGRKQELDEAPRLIGPRLRALRPSWMVDAIPPTAPAAEPTGLLGWLRALRPSSLVPPSAIPPTAPAAEPTGLLGWLRALRPSWMVDAVPPPSSLVAPSAATPRDADPSGWGKSGPWLSDLLDTVKRRLTPAPWMFGSGNPNPSSLVPPSALAPPGLTGGANVSAPITVNVTSASDTPQAIGIAAGAGAKSGTLDGIGRALSIAVPRAEYGWGY